MGDVVDMGPREKRASKVVGPLENRASKATSNVRLYDLVQDMARVIDTLPEEFDEVHAKLDAIMERLDGITESP